MDNNLNHFQFKIHQLSREELAYALKLSSRLERYDEVLEIVKLLSLHNEQLCEEEYKLFDQALSFYFCSKIQPIKKMEQKNLDSYQYEQQEKLGQNFLQNIINNYKLNIIRESEEIIQTIERLLMNKNISDLQRYHCYSIKGDCYRYIAENNLGNIHSVDDALQAYLQAEEVLSRIKISNFKDRHSLNFRICLILNIMDDPTKTAIIYKQILEKLIKQQELPDFNLNDNQLSDFISRIKENIEIIFYNNQISKQNISDYFDLDYLFQ